MEIGAKAFYECKNLKSICMPDKLQEIKNYAFSSTGLTEVQIPASVQTIENSAFYNCDML